MGISQIPYGLDVEYEEKKTRMTLKFFGLTS